MKKWIKISLIVFIALLVVGISSKFWGPWLRDNLQGKIESWLGKPQISSLQTIETADQSVNAPTKPNYLLAVIVTMEDLKNENEVVKKIQEIGANSIFIFLPVLKDEQPSTMLGYTKSLITQARKNHLSTGIVLDTIISTQSSGSKPEYPEVLSVINKYLVETSKFAQEQSVAYLQVAGEVDNILEMTKTESQTPELIKELLQTVKDGNYSGEVGVGFDICNQAPPAKCRLTSFDYDLTGFDFSSTSIYLSGRQDPITDPINQYQKYLEPIISSLKNNNQKYGVGKTYQLVNAGSVWSKDAQGCEEVKDLCYPFSANEEAEFYQKTLPAAKPLVDGIIIPYSALDNSQASQAIKNFYQSP